jgi:hypothetical protein
MVAVSSAARSTANDGYAGPISAATGPFFTALDAVLPVQQELRLA